MPLGLVARRAAFFSPLYPTISPERVLKGKGYARVLVRFLSKRLDFIPLKATRRNKQLLLCSRKLIASQAFTLVGGKISGVDLVQEVLRVVPIQWAAVDLVSSIRSSIYLSLVLMILFREVFSSKLKTIIMVLIQLLNFLIYWAIFIRELTLQSIIDMN